MLLRFTLLLFSTILPLHTALCQAVKTVIQKDGKDFVLSRDGKPYFIQGVAANSLFRQAAESGANSVRISHHDLAAAALDSAHAAGLTVTVVLRIPTREQGFNTSNSSEAAALIESFNSVILAHKNHPALLMWAAGIEINRLEQGNSVYALVNNLAKLCHVLDPNHPVMTILGGASKEEINLVKKNIPEIDLLGINTYDALEGLPSAMRAWGWTKPYVVSEWGSSSDKNAPKTTWEAPVEQTSTEKALAYRRRYEDAIAVDVRYCLGSFAGIWGTRFSSTPTWQGLFLDSGEMLGGADELNQIFTRKRPANLAPEISSVKIASQTAFDNVILGLDSEFSAWVQASDPDGDSLSYRWEVLADTFFYAPPETRPEPISGLIVNNYGQRISFRTPDKQGMYRLYVYVYDRRGKAATGNIPFFVN